MTSNAGASSIKRQTSLGFGAMSEDEADFEGMKEKILEESKKQFKPEFLNRLDDLVVFRMLEKESLSIIVDLEIEKLLVRLKEKEIELELEQSAREFLIKEGYDPNFGARPMRRLDLWLPANPVSLLPSPVRKRHSRTRLRPERIRIHTSNQSRIELP